MRCYLFSLLALILGVNSLSPVFAQKAEADVPNVQPGDVHLETSRVYVFVDKRGLGHQHGVEAQLLTSSLAVGATENAGQLVFDMASFKADTQAARKYVGLTGTTDEATRRAVDENMKGSAVLNIRQYPTAIFDVTSAKATGQTSAKGRPLYQLDGQFTLHGTQRPLSIIAEVEQRRGWLHLKGVFSIRQTDYGITPYSKAFGAIGVADELRIYGDLYVAPSPHISLNDFPLAQEPRDPG